MKAIVYYQYGSPDVLQLKNLEKPNPKADEVLIKVHASTVNRTDCAMLRAKPHIMRLFLGLLKPRKTILGTDFAGEIEAIGEKVTQFKIGDRVFGFDDNILSSHAEYMTLSEKNALATIPDETSYEQAAASIEGAHYAYNFIKKLDFSTKQKVLVNGATGAIGSAAVQLLKSQGAHVTAVCNTKNLELIKSIGADKVIDLTQEDFTKSKEKFNYVFDAVGKSSFKKCKALLEPKGIYISSELGDSMENPFLALLTPLFGKKKVIFPFPTDRKGSVLYIKRLIEEGKFNAVIDRKYKLEEIPEAYRYVEKGQKTGNVVIKIA